MLSVMHHRGTNSRVYLHPTTTLLEAGKRTASPIKSYHGDVVVVVGSRIELLSAPSE
jgi:hypothetical protein